MSGIRVLALLIVAILGLTPASPAEAQQAAPPPEIAELNRLLADPSVQEWLRAELTPDETPAESALADGAMELEVVLSRWATHRAVVMAALPELPGEIGRALGRLSAEAADHGMLLVVLLVALFVGAGLAAEWAFGRLTRPMRHCILAADEDTIAERLHKLAMRLGLVLGTVLVFAAASLGVFLLLELPPLLRDVAGRFLFAAILFRLFLHLCRLVLSPYAAQRRVLPIDDSWAGFWLRRLTVFTGIFIFGWAVATSLRTLGAGFPYSLVVGYLFGIGLLATTVATVWQRRARLAAIDPEEGAGYFPAIAWTVYAAAIFVLWTTGANRLMWLLLVGGLLPLAIRVTNASVNNLLRPAGKSTEIVEGEVPPPEPGPPSVAAAAIERGARALLIASAALFLFWAWDLDARAMMSGTGEMSPVSRALLNLALIVIVFDFVWHVGSTAIDSYIRGAQSAEGIDAAEARRRARLRTLLPIFRKVLQAVLALTGILMVLSALGVQIGPLIAGAGVVGVAVGFGSQTLVRDIISGMFYLLDDAFRVGEYIISDKYKGVVESFSLRSIKLRHHRGPLYTIPFGSLGAVQNMSREWVIVKLAFTVPFETDLGKVKKAIKWVSAELLADPELAPGFLEPLKSQGADEIAPHGIVIRVKYKAIPGTQFTIRRRANALIKQALADNGIPFAYPIVRVAGEGEHPHAAAAQAAIQAQAAQAAE